MLINNSQTKFLVKQFANMLAIHLNVLLNSFDVIIDCSYDHQSLDAPPPPLPILPSIVKINEIQQHQKSIHYASVLVYSLPVILDTIWILANENFHYTSNGLPELFTHKIFPREMWYIGDMILLSGIAMTLSLYGYLSLNPPPSNEMAKYRMYNVLPIQHHQQHNFLQLFTFSTKKKQQQIKIVQHGFGNEYD